MEKKKVWMAFFFLDAFHEIGLLRNKTKLNI